MIAYSLRKAIQRSLAATLLAVACTDGSNDGGTADHSLSGGTGGAATASGDGGHTPSSSGGAMASGGSSTDWATGGSGWLGGFGNVGGVFGLGGESASGGASGSGGNSDLGGNSATGGMATGGMATGGSATGGSDGATGGNAGAGADASGGSQPEHWVGTWGTSPQLTEPDNNPPSPGLANNTLRQFVYASIGGSRLRIQVSNEFGNGPVTLSSVHLAASAGSGSAILAGTDVQLAFTGSASVTIPAGQAVYSDPFDFPLTEQTSVAVTMHFGSVPSGIDGHPGSRTTSYIVTGDAAASATLTGAVTTDHWYYLTRIEVMAPASAGTVVTLGDSLTDGRGSTTNGNNRWPDALSRRLRANASTAQVAVINAGIGGNAVVSGGLGPTARERFERDVLGQAGVRWVIVLEGVNDIGGANDTGGPNSESVAASLIAAYEELIAAAHAHAADVLIYGVPILPIGGSSYDSDNHEQARQIVNEWIRNSEAFDAVLDLESVVADPGNPTQLRSDHDDGDHLHLSPAGYQAMADAIDLSLFNPGG